MGREKARVVLQNNASDAASARLFFSLAMLWLALLRHIDSFNR